jgi:hypothetical protein
LRSYLPARKAQGRPRTHSLRDILNEIIYADKTQYHAAWDLMNRYARSAERALQHIELVPRLYELSKTLPPSELKDLIEKEYEEHKKLSREKELSEEKEEYKKIQQKHIDLRIMRIERSPLPYEAVSRDIDFSLERIGALINQGYKGNAEEGGRNSAVEAREHPDLSLAGSAALPTGPGLPYRPGVAGERAA